MGNYRTVVKNFHSRRRRGEMLGVSGRGRIVEQPAFRNEIRIERHVFVVFHLVRAAASTTNQLKYRLYTLLLHGAPRVRRLPSCSCRRFDYKPVKVPALYALTTRSATCSSSSILFVPPLRLQTTGYARTTRKLLGLGKVLEAHVALALRARAT